MEIDRFRCNRVIFDTNALIYAAKKRIDLSEFKILLPSTVLNELKRLEEKLSGIDRIAVRIALKIVEKAELVESEEGDKGILETAKKFRCSLITNDRNLRKKAEKLGIPVGYLKLRKVVFS
ncbi:MAG: PIN domain-containing protein [Archaeoglobaceae archaeon]|nr:PIN domain-containing protein [Archaeoglobaceae archaeon]MDW7989577.1 PIN domain-containing protein [Archaeoglobaceae archaeon]